MSLLSLLLLLLYYYYYYYYDYYYYDYDYDYHYRYLVNKATDYNVLDGKHFEKGTFRNAVTLR